MLITAEGDKEGRRKFRKMYLKTNSGRGCQPAGDDVERIQKKDKTLHRRKRRKHRRILNRRRAGDKKERRYMIGGEHWKRMWSRRYCGGYREDKDT